jgi:hypothetical protein
MFLLLQICQVFKVFNEIMSLAGNIVERSDFSLTPAIEVAIGPQSQNINDRVKTLRDISNVVLQKNLEEVMTSFSGAQFF